MNPKTVGRAMMALGVAMMATLLLSGLLIIYMLTSGVFYLLSLAVFAVTAALNLLGYKIDRKMEKNYIEQKQAETN